MLICGDQNFYTILGIRRSMFDDTEPIKHLTLLLLTRHCDVNLGQWYEYEGGSPNKHFLPCSKINLNNTSDT